MVSHIHFIITSAHLFSTKKYIDAYGIPILASLQAFPPPLSLMMIGYALFMCVVRLLQITPFWVMYRLSDGLYLLMRHVVRYRYKVVAENLKRCFPEKSESEIRNIIHQFYQHLCDIALESLKGFTCSKMTLTARVRLRNPELADQYYAEGKDCLALAAHCGNYEWVASVGGLQLKYLPLILYKPLSNKYIDAFVRNSRKQYGTLFASIYDTEKVFHTHFERPVVYGLAADQSPSNLSKAYWVKFFGIDTACLHGGEKYACERQLRGIYYDIRRVKRGYYDVWLREIDIDPYQTYEGEFTQKFMQMVEHTIREAPESWLWSHRRWKHHR